MTAAQAYQDDVRSLRDEVLNTILNCSRACNVKLAASRIVENQEGSPYPRQFWYFDCPSGAREALCTQVDMDEVSGHLCMWVSSDGEEESGEGEPLRAEPFNHSPAQRAIWAIIQRIGCSN